MKAIDIVRTCLRNLTKRKVRTLLTVSGVLIGTCAIIVMISLGVGMNEALTAMISEWADLTVINIQNYPGMQSQENQENQVQPPDLNAETIETIRQIEHVKSAMSFYEGMSTDNQLAIYTDNGKTIVWNSIIGVDMSEMENFGYKLKEGRFKQEGDPASTMIFGNQVGEYIYDYEYEEYLYAERNWETWELISKPIEDFMQEKLRVAPLVKIPNDWGWYDNDYSQFNDPNAPSAEYDTEVKLVGILEEDQSDWQAMQGIFVDMAFLEKMIKAYNELNPEFQYEEFNGVYNNVRVRVDDMDNVAAVEEAIKAMGFSTWSYNEIRENMRQQVVTIQLLLAALAAISLFVAALNITNTMIMAIIERTKEIGIMKVLGCDIGKIRILFLGEAAAIGFLGGVAGTALSFILSFVINNFFGQMILGFMGGGVSEEPVTISIIPLWLILAALGFATLVGVVSGFYPANRSVKISALAAISHE